MPELIRCQIKGGFTQNFRTGITEHFAVGVVGIGYFQILSHEDKSLSGGFHNAAKLFFTFAHFFFSQLAAGNVHQQALVKYFVAIRIPHHRGLVFNPADLAVFGHNPVKLGIFFNVFFGVLLDFFTDTLKIVGMNNISKMDLIFEKLFGRIPHLADVVGNIHQAGFVTGHPPKENHRAVVDNHLGQAKFFLGATAQLDVLVRNIGTDFLTVSSITAPRRQSMPCVFWLWRRKKFKLRFF